MGATAINLDVARKVLATVDAGLVKGMGNPVPGQMCVEAAVCFALGLPHSDEPACVAPGLRTLKLVLNDKAWSSNKARAKGLRRLALAQLGSAGALDEDGFANRVAALTIRKQVPLALRIAASLHHDAKHRQALTEAAARCEKEGTCAAANAAEAAANAAEAAANAAAYAYATANAAAYAYATANAAAYAAAEAAAAAAAAAYADAAAAAYAAADAAANAADAAATAAVDAAKKKRRDDVLSEFAEDVVQILIAMGAPGAQWLSLTEEAA